MGGNLFMKKISLILLIGSLFTLGACGNKNEATSNTISNSKVTIRDVNGKISVPKNPEEVVVFDNSALDTMNVLGVGEKVVGAAVDNLPSFLADYKEKESAGGIKEPDLEKVNALKPDLIFISGRQSDFQKELSSIAQTVYFSTDNEKPWESMQSQVREIAKIFQKKDQAEKELALLQEKITETAEKAKNSGRALILLVNEGSLSAFGPNSRFGIVHEAFGFTPADVTIGSSTHGQNVSYEYVLEQNPDIIFVIDRTKAIGGDDSQNNIAENELVKQTTAGKNGKVISLDSDVCYLAGSGLESVKMMIENVQKAF